MNRYPPGSAKASPGRGKNDECFAEQEGQYSFAVESHEPPPAKKVCGQFRRAPPTDLDAISNERAHPWKCLSFDDAQGTEPGDPAGQAGVMDDVNHGINILVGFGNFFQDAVARGGA